MDIICKRKDFFNNPEKLPLNKLFLDYKTVIRTAGEIKPEQLISKLNNPKLISEYSNHYRVKTEKRPALDKCWLKVNEDRIEFQPYFGQFSDAQNEDFLPKNQKFLNYCKYLLNCTYHMFWCNLMSGRCATVAIRDFLQYGLPPYEVSKLSPTFKTLYIEIVSCLSAIYKRILNFNCSEIEYLPENIVRQFLSKSELINVRSIYSLNFIYSRINKPLIQQLFEFYFIDKNEICYKKELKELFEDISEDLDNLSGNSFNISSNFLASKKSDTYDLPRLEELCFYALELTSTLTSFLFVYEPAIEISLSLEIPNKVPQVHRKLHTCIQKLMKADGKMHEASKLQNLTRTWSNHLEIQLISLFHIHLRDLHSKIIANEGEMRDEYFETYLGLLSITMDEEVFIKKYASMVSIQEEFQKFNNLIPNFDNTQTDYLLYSLESLIQMDQQQNLVNNDQNINNHSENLNPCSDQIDVIYDTLMQYLDTKATCFIGPSTSTASSSCKIIPDVVCDALKLYVMMKKFDDHNLEDIIAEETPSLSQEKINECIKAVQEMLPDLDSPFILKCLKEMDYKPEVVISRILDGELSSDLKESIKKVPAYVDFAPTKREVEMVGYHGKRNEFRDANEFLNKKDVNIKELVLKASNKYDMDDDYDDRIDISGSYYNEDESKLYRHIQQPELYNEVEEESSSEEEDVEPEQKKGGPKAFCEDPAVIRARNEARRAAKYNNSRNPANKPKTPAQESDNSKKVKKDRNNKTVNKSSKGNHNRKGGAQWKQSRGMIPS